MWRHQRPADRPAPPSPTHLSALGVGTPEGLHHQPLADELYAAFRDGLKQGIRQDPHAAMS